MSLIRLDNLEFYAFHGCFKEEQIIGTRFRVDFWCETDTSEAEKSDKLEDTVNYQEIYLIIKKEMEQKSHLLEHVAHRIIQAVKQRFQEIQYAGVTVAKMNPPLGGKVGSVSISIEK